MEKKTLKKILLFVFDFIFPLFSVWVIIAYIRILNYLHTNNILPTWSMFFLFLVIVFLELIFNKIFKKEEKLIPKPLLQKIFLILRILFWGVLYFLWAVFMPLSDEDRLWLEFVHFSFVPMTLMVLIAESFLSYVAGIVWFLLYYFLTVRKKLFRLTTSLFLPIILVGGLFYDYYFIGGVGKLSDKDIEAQNGVEIIYRKDDFPNENKEDYYWFQKELFSCAREIHFDRKRNSLYTNYASTYGDSSGAKTPSILKIDLTTKQTIYYKSYYSRTFFATEDTILTLPWFDYKIYEISKDNLSLIREIPAQTDIWPLEILNLYVDSKKQYIYVFNDMRPAIFKYDYKTGKLLKHVIFWNLKYSCCVWNPQFDEENKKIYLCVFGGKDDIWELDSESLEILRGIDIVWYGGSQLLLDKENKLLYFQDGGTNRLFEIDKDTFKVKRILPGEVHARSIILDKKRNCLYLFSYFFGRMTCVDLKTGRVVFRILVGGKPYGACLVDDIIYVNSANGVVKVNLDRVWQKYAKK